MLSSNYRLTNGDIVSESFDGEIVVVDLNNGKYFSFSDSGNVAWHALTSGVSPGKLLELQAPSISREDLETFVGNLIGHGLICESESAATVPGEDIAMRLQASRERLEVAVFEDLADLFLADPIHDVEESKGWPMVREPSQ